MLHADNPNYAGWQQAGRARTMDALPEAVETDRDDI